MMNWCCWTCNSTTSSSCIYHHIHSPSSPQFLLCCLAMFAANNIPFHHLIELFSHYTIVFANIHSFHFMKMSNIRCNVDCGRDDAMTPSTPTTIHYSFCIFIVLLFSIDSLHGSVCVPPLMILMNKPRNKLRMWKSTENIYISNSS